MYRNILLAALASVTLIGCPSMSSVRYQHYPVLQDTPKIMSYVSEKVYVDKDGVQRYREALISYVEYLTSHIDYINVRYSLDRVNSKCPGLVEITPAPTFNVPDITTSNKDEIIKILLSQMMKYDDSIQEYNQQLEIAKRKFNRNCKLF